MTIKTFTYRVSRLLVLFLLLLPSEYIFSFPVSKFMVNNYIYWGSLGQTDVNCEIFKISKINNTVFLDEIKVDKGLSSCLLGYLSNKDKLIVSSNGGGSVAESIVISKYIKDYEIEVYSLGDCDSACINIVAASQNSKMCKDATFAAHQAEIGDNLSFLDFYYQEMANEIVLSNLVSSGVDEAFIVNVFKMTPNEDMRVINSDEALKYGFVKEVLDCEKPFVF